MKKKSNREVENEQARGKKRYQERIAEEKEAEKLIKDFELEEQEFPDRDED